MINAFRGDRISDNQFEMDVRIVFYIKLIDRHATYLIGAGSSRPLALQL